MLLIIGIVIISLASVISLLIFGPWIASFVQPTPPQPVIRYGEFPFKLEYEINGQVVVVEDTIICKYKGIDVTFGEGKFLKWEGYLASGKESAPHDEVSLLIDGANQIYFRLGGPAWYLGYMSVYYPGYGSPSFHAWSPSSFGIISTDDLWNKYNIRIISFEPSPPIENTFK